MKRVISILCVLVIFQSVFAINVEGVVIDKATNEPIIDAVILALSNNIVLTSANSNSKGEFRIALKKGKAIRLEVVKNGYKTENADIVINQDFIEADPYITIKLSSREAFVATENSNKNEVPNEMEDVGNLNELPEGYKIIEAVPIKEREERETGYNVRPEVKDQTTNVNVDVLKTEYNKDIDTEALNPNHNFANSYYKNGHIFYNVVKAFLSKDVKEILEGIALKLKNDPELVVSINAHSDANREAPVAEYISKMRVEEIVNLFMNAGVSFEQLEVNIFGSNLISNGCKAGVDCTEKQHQENRRVELVFSK